ncbi:MAG: AraC family transcriptional regulator [Deltaproteobacteria bacterium]|nr:AraC family transcriptional regulator [Deltaproteobacteria bacterium]
MESPKELRLSTRGLPVAEQFATWRDAMSESTVPVRLDIEREGEPFAADVLMRSLGAFQLSSTTTTTPSPNRVTFSYGPSEISRTPEHALILSYRVNESNAFAYNGRREVVFPAGNWCLYNTEDRVTASAHVQHARQIMLRIPPQAAARFACFSGDCFGIPRPPDNAANVLMIRYLETLALGPVPGAAEGQALGQHLLDLVLLALNHSPDQAEASQKGISTALVAAIEQEIEANFLEPEFHPASAAALLGMSTRYLHKILEPTGISFSKRLLQRRLAHARGLLSASGAARLGILEVALECGFGSAEHFSQCFRAAFGMSPRDFRNGRTP